MTPPQFRRVTTPREIETVVNIAGPIWMEHYASIIGADQVNYMLRTLHSKAAIADEIAHKNARLYLIELEGQNVGYLSVHPREESLFLSKVYIQSSTRGNGLGKAALQFVKDMAERDGHSAITLTVNKMNLNTIAIYEKIGFEKTQEVTFDIGEGYVMDDYVMTWQL
ncbi:MAG: GNAT family N-acetyltransferase [Boseongicola sp.]|nr:MAG: GNAT family N-acetyltransferase [Boseongicola sp.]